MSLRKNQFSQESISDDKRTITISGSSRRVNVKISPRELSLASGSSRRVIVKISPRELTLPPVHPGGLA
eukprot:3097772-Pyramimonas_sp.AAC.1